MLKKTIDYTDYNGVTHSEPFYFNLNKAELTQWELETTGGLMNLLEIMIVEKNRKQMAEMFKVVINKAYGVKSIDGKQFIKNQTVLDAFIQTEAYSNLYMELVSSDEAASGFIKGIIPQMPQDKITAPSN